MTKKVNTNTNKSQGSHNQKLVEYFFTLPKRKRRVLLDMRIAHDYTMSLAKNIDPSLLDKYVYTKKS